MRDTRTCIDRSIDRSIDIEQLSTSDLLQVKTAARHILKWMKDRKAWQNGGTGPGGEEADGESRSIGSSN